jgi:hypothetical protein
LSAGEKNVLEQLQNALSASVGRHQGLLSSPEVVRASQELDRIIMRIMLCERQGDR